MPRTNVSPAPRRRPRVRRNSIRVAGRQLDYNPPMSLFAPKDADDIGILQAILETRKGGKGD